MSLRLRRSSIAATLATAASLVLPTAAAAAAPANDDFADAIDIGSGSSFSVVGDNAEAFVESGEAYAWQGFDATTSTVWYRWTPSATHWTTIAVSSDVFAANAAAFTGGTLGTSSRVFSDSHDVPYPTACGTSTFRFRAIAGTSYRIAVGTLIHSVSDGIYGGPFQLCGVQSDPTSKRPNGLKCRKGKKGRGQRGKDGNGKAKKCKNGKAKKRSKR